MSSSSIIIRSYRGESDLPKIIDLIDACERVDLLEVFVSIDQLRLSVTDPAIDRECDLGLWEDAQGKLIGSAIDSSPNQLPTILPTVRYRFSFIPLPAMVN